jgi:hypothetical protein
MIVSQRPALNNLRPNPYPYDVFGLDEVANSNTWVELASGYVGGGPSWQTITSDATGTNLVAGTYDVGMKRYSYGIVSVRMLICMYECMYV